MPDTFQNCKKLTSVTLSNKLTVIGRGAFDGCTSLTSITIPNSVKEIQPIAFRDSGLTSVTIPRSVESIDNDAFWCNNLTSVTFEGRISRDKFGGYAYNTEPFPGDLRDLYFSRDGGPGTYVRFAGGKSWKKQ